MEIRYANDRVEKYFSNWGEMKRKLPIVSVEIIIEGVVDYHGGKDNWFIS